MGIGPMSRLPAYSHKKNRWVFGDLLQVPWYVRYGEEKIKSSGIIFSYDFLASYLGVGSNPKNEGN